MNVWGWVALLGLFFAILLTTIGWLRRRDRQAEEREANRSEIEGLKDALSRSEKARRHKPRGRTYLRSILDKLRDPSVPPNKDDTPGPP